MGHFGGNTRRGPMRPAPAANPKPSGLKPPVAGAGATGFRPKDAGDVRNPTAEFFRRTGGK